MVPSSWTTLVFIKLKEFGHKIDCLALIRAKICLNVGIFYISRSKKEFTTAYSSNMTNTDIW